MTLTVTLDINGQVIGKFTIDKIKEISKDENEYSINNGDTIIIHNKHEDVTMLASKALGCMTDRDGYYELFRTLIEDELINSDGDCKDGGR